MMKRVSSVKKYLVLFLFIGVTIAGIFFSQPKVYRGLVSHIHSSSAQKTKKEKKVSSPLAVPLENQLDPDKLENGCEVTALSMLLRYSGYKVTKNTLASQLTYVPVMVDATYHGNPHDGFVGNIEGGLEAMGVAVEPIATLTKSIVGGDKEVVSGSAIDFSEVEDAVNAGKPVWVITTVDYVTPQETDWLTWQTTSGIITVCRICHSVVVTGVDANSVYVNDPYGYKNRKVPIEQFKEAYAVMGEQMLYLK
ncbi:hypothetical protein IGI37_002211 [Enterococcus sp. AZ194]|uniref:C39 family peptidase n=1 Tax=Enterococcus sp. AZ194 TaxID=2774629 RepID=UPI003F23000A